MSVKSGKRALLEHIPKLFPQTTKLRKTNATTTKTFYKGITLKSIDCDLEPSLSLEDIGTILPPNFALKEITNNCLICYCPCPITVNGNTVMKTLTFFINGKWKLQVGDTYVDTTHLDIRDQFERRKQSVLTICDIVSRLSLCEGHRVTTSVVVTRFHVIDMWKRTDTVEKQQRRIRSVVCNKVISINSNISLCIKCQRMTFNTSPKHDKENKCPKDSTAESNATKDKIKSMIPGASDEMMKLLLGQAQNTNRDPRGRRWSADILNVCLQWYSRSPQAYGAFLKTNFLILPSPSTLVYYKNKVKHEVGFDDNIMEWMHEEASRKSLPEEGWFGGIVMDEMSIQSDLQICKSGDLVELAGLLDVGEEGCSCHTIRTGKGEKILGTHALQLVFLGVTGFRFPFAHFITDGVQATELYPIFWQAVDRLQMYGFKVIYTCMDGAQSNRTFIKYNIGSQKSTFKCPSPCSLGEMVFMMDVSHVIKKIRNNLQKSGITRNCTRLLTLPSSQTVQWQMFVDCYQWDKRNALQLHQRLTNEHFFLSNQSKMRNHLAEEVLNAQMLHLMMQYQVSLGEKGEVLNGVIEFLKVTSKLIEFFRDMRPIRVIEDERLTEVKSVSQWFAFWETCAANNNDMSQKEKGKMLMSYQCHEDIHSCVIGFIEMCGIVLKDNSTIFITPALVNSDVVENTFNQQRATYNGANSNPNALQYRRALNSIILGQNIISTKANAGRGRDAAVPYGLNLKVKKRKVDGKI